MKKNKDNAEKVYKFKENSNFKFPDIDLFKVRRVLVLGNIEGIFGYRSDLEYYFNLNCMMRFNLLRYFIQKPELVDIIDVVAPKSSSKDDYMNTMIQYILENYPSKNRYNIKNRYRRYIVKDNKDYFDFMNKVEEQGEKYDLAIMNPPYDKGLHMLFLEQIENFAETTISIQPISDIRDYQAFDKPLKRNIKVTSIPAIFSVEDSCNIFPEACIRQDLGIVLYIKGCETDIKNISLYNKNIIDKCLLYVKNKKDNLYKHLELKYTDGLTLKFNNGGALYGNGKLSKGTFRLSAIDYNLATSKEEVGHVKRLNHIPNKNVQRNLWEFYNSIYMRNWYHLCLFSEQNYDFVPFIDYEYFNRNDKWLEEDYRNFFINEIGLSNEEWEFYKNEAEKLPV